MIALLQRVRPYALSVVRIVVALLFMEHGVDIVFQGVLSGHASATPTGIIAAAGYIELIGGAVLALGLLTRLCAFILCGQMAVAYFMAHASQGFFPLANGGELAVFYCFVFLYFVFAGPGPISLDAFFLERDETY